MNGKATGPAIRQQPDTEGHAQEPIAAFRHDPRRTIPFLATLAMMMGLGVFAVVQLGLREGWVAGLLFVVMPGVLLAGYVRDLRLGPPLLIATREGLIDRRRSRSTILWDDIAEASPRNRLLGKGLKLILSDGEKIDMDLSLLDAEPKDVMLLIHAAARERGDVSASA